MKGGAKSDARKGPSQVDKINALTNAVSKRNEAGFLRSTRREWMAMIVAAATVLLTSDFFSMCMTLLLVEDVSPTAFTY